MAAIAFGRRALKVTGDSPGVQQNFKKSLGISGGTSRFWVNFRGSQGRFKGFLGGLNGASRYQKRLLGSFQVPHEGLQGTQEVPRQFPKD